MSLAPGKRVGKLPPYLFVEIDKKKKAALAKGVDIINLGVGDPDLPTPDHIVKAMQAAVAKPAHHQYPFGAGLPEFRRAVAQWYGTRFGVTLDPDTEVHALLGSKEGLGHITLAYCDPGEVVLVPEPGYPVYGNSTILAGGRPHLMPLRAERDFLPDLSDVAPRVLSMARLMFLNYPNNPTAATAGLEFFEEVVAYAKKHHIVVVHDAAYSELYFDNKPPHSFLEVKGAKAVGVEMHSCSKTYSMTGWRVGFAVGNAEVLKALSQVKDNFDSGVFGAAQEAAIAALTGPQDCVVEARRMYQERRDALVLGLTKLGWQVHLPRATFYVWTKVPGGKSVAAASRILEEAGVVCTPGIGFGPSGEGYLRFALTQPVSRIQEAVTRIAKLRW